MTSDASVVVFGVAGVFVFGTLLLQVGLDFGGGLPAFLGFKGCLNEFEALWGVLSGLLGRIWVLIGLRQYENIVLSACSLSVDRKSVV